MGVLIGINGQQITAFFERVRSAQWSGFFKPDFRVRKRAVILQFWIRLNRSGGDPVVLIRWFCRATLNVVLKKAFDAPRCSNPGGATDFLIEQARVLRARMALGVVWPIRSHNCEIWCVALARISGGVGNLGCVHRSDRWRRTRPGRAAHSRSLPIRCGDGERKQHNNGHGCLCEQSFPLSHDSLQW